MSIFNGVFNNPFAEITQYWDYQEFNEVTSNNIILTTSDNRYNGKGVKLPPALIRLDRIRVVRNQDMSLNLPSTLNYLRVVRVSDFNPPRMAGITNIFNSQIEITNINIDTGEITLSGVPRQADLPIRICYQYNNRPFNPEPLPEKVTKKFLRAIMNAGITGGGTTPTAPQEFFGSRFKLTELPIISEYYRQYADESRNTLQAVIRQRFSRDEENRPVITVEIPLFSATDNYSLGDEVYSGNNVYRRIGDIMAVDDDITNTAVWQNLLTLLD